MPNRRWDVSSNGPDWTDVFALMKAIEALHGVVVTVGLSASLHDGCGGFSTIAALQVDKENSVLGSPVAALSAEFPCKLHKDLVTCVFAGLYELDAAITKKLWEQLPLPFTAE